MRIAVRKLPLAHEHAALFEYPDHDGIRFKHGLALVLRQAFDESSFVILRRVSLQPVFLSRAKVVRAVARRRVYDAAALIERHVIGEHARHAQFEKRMLELDPFKLPSFPRSVRSA